MNAMMSSVRLWLAITILSGFIDHRATAATLEDWRNRTIYQVLTDRFARSDGSTTAECNVVDGLYCGGSWRGIADKLDYIQGMNFDAIWISPVVAQLTETTIDGEAYTAYWAQDLYALNSNFGTADELHQLIRDVHDRGMYLMLDIVVNHMGFAGKGTDANYSIFNPFDDKKYFHDYCQVDDDGNQTNVETCWLGDDIVALADLRTEDQEVQDMFGEWISEMVRNYSIDGLRIDTTINVDPAFFPSFVDAAGVFATGETMDGDNRFVCRWAEAIGSVLNYPIYYPLTRAFSSPQGNINDLVSTIYTNKDNCMDPTAFGLFSENHDVERFPSITDDMSQAKNILTYTIMGDGIPIIYQGQEQHMDGGTSPYTNRAPLWTTGYDTDAQLYEHIATLVKARQAIVGTSSNYTTYISDVIYEDYHTFAMRKGIDGAQAITILNNNGVLTDDFDIHMDRHGFTSGTKVMEILSCVRLKVNSTGYLTVPMGKGLPKVIYPENNLKDSGLCGYSEPSRTIIVTAIPTTYETTISGYPTVLSTSEVITTTSTGKPSHTRLALGSACQLQTSLTLFPCFVAALTTIIFTSSGCFFVW